VKKFFVYAAMIAAAVPVQITMLAPAHARGYNNIPAFCKDYVASGEDPELNRGECIALLTQQFHYYVDDKNANAYSVHACDYYQENYPDIFYALWDSKQQCVDEFLTT